MLQIDFTRKRKVFSGVYLCGIQNMRKKKAAPKKVKHFFEWDGSDRSEICAGKRAI